jgi:hypothetical protein
MQMHRRFRWPNLVGAEARYATLARTHPEQPEHLLALLEAHVRERWSHDEQLEAMQRSVPQFSDGAVTAGEDEFVVHQQRESANG